MHELGIMEAALEAAAREGRAQGGGELLRIVLRVGALSGADAESLRFAFEALAPLRGVTRAELDIENGPGRELELVRLELGAP